MAREHTGLERGPVLVVMIDGTPLDVRPDTTVAAALVSRYGVRGTRRSVSGQPRAALCGMGVCQECRVSVDERAHVLACQTICRDGMIIRTEVSTS
ncbi:ferredoxin [Trinickia dabaoshanensis]|uniref:Ferredoxin n=1 Tax=Trinickia dabaoshanensis TaxID=564714 RepID=A0A2N7VY77_9BURK|nr:(2Fe-2S)-binding protein [Trinickia dabaoshanensis]PMS22107.1 ferredoxin [Trinickia dabaoshanensis]